MNIMENKEILENIINAIKEQTTVQKGDVAIGLYMALEIIKARVPDEWIEDFGLNEDFEKKFFGI